MTDFAQKQGSIRWTGHNLDELESFARGCGLSFTVGSNVHRYRWWHRAFNWLVCQFPARWLVDWEWEPADDPEAIEVYNLRARHSRWTHVLPGDWIRDDGTVARAGTQSVVLLYLPNALAGGAAAAVLVATVVGAS